MTSYLLILIGTVFVNNIVMVKILVRCPFMGISRKLEATIGMGAAGLMSLAFMGFSGLVKLKCRRRR